MPNCCQGATCACKYDTVEDGHILISGSGSANDPFLLTADLGLTVQDTPQFDLSLAGTGTSDDPWVISVGYAAAAKLANIPDVNAPAPTNAQVLGFDTASGKWVPQNPTTAAAGSVLHGPSLSGDGSSGTPLMVVPDASRLLQTSSSGVGLSNNGMSAVVQHFATTGARSAMSPAPVLNQLSMVDTNPGRVDYYNGTSWAPLLDQITVDAASPALLVLSGSYSGLSPITHLLKTVTLTADGSGVVTLVDSSDLSGFAGVLDAHFQETGTTPIRVLINASAGVIKGTAYRLTDGSPASGVTVTGMVRAYLY